MVTVKKFSAVWCGPCRALTPVINEIKGNYSNVKFEEILEGSLALIKLKPAALPFNAS